MWTSLDQIGQVKTNVDEFGQVWTNLDKFRPIWRMLSKYLGLKKVHRLSLCFFISYWVLSSETLELINLTIKV